MKQIKHVIDTELFDKKLLDLLFDRADYFADSLASPDSRKQISKLLDGKMVFAVFFEPSTRTRLSFTAAAQHLGAQVITAENARETSSATKGETLEDTIKVLCGYKPDAIVMRHNQTGGAATAATVSNIPIINAGDGSGEHPTQSLLDLYTIHKELGRITDLNVVIGGDLANGRTARSLSRILARFPGNKLTFVAPASLQMGDDIKQYLTQNNVEFTETEDLESALPTADVVYWTRVQKERIIGDLPKGTFIIDLPQIKLMQDHAILMHPLPRVDEITPAVDSTPQAAHFRQAENGLYARMALLEWILK